jgi:hypothetical protein
MVVQTAAFSTHARARVDTDCPLTLHIMDKPIRGLDICLTCGSEGLHVKVTNVRGDLVLPFHIIELRCLL